MRPGHEKTLIVSCKNIYLLIQYALLKGHRAFLFFCIVEISCYALPAWAEKRTTTPTPKPSAVATGHSSPSTPSNSASGDDFSRRAAQLGGSALSSTSSTLRSPSLARPPLNTHSAYTPTNASSLDGGWLPNHCAIVTTTFWVGERPTANNPTPNNKSSWDMRWATNYGGTDDPSPANRVSGKYIPKRFIPRQNPFYCALPYNDISRDKDKGVARIPWFAAARKFGKSGKTVLKGRWVAIRPTNNPSRIAYAQWEDCGPFRTDHHRYVFGLERPLGNLNKGAGLDISPAVRDYLGIKSTDNCDWKFVEAREVAARSPANAPWKLYGDNNTFKILRDGKDPRIHDPNNAASLAHPIAPASPARPVTPYRPAGSL